MDPFAVSHFSDAGLLHNTKLIVAHDNGTNAVMLTRIAEIDHRKLFLREGYPSMHSYCVRELNFSEGVAYKRIEAARTARRFPCVLLAFGEGRVHLRAVVMLAPHLTSGNAAELLAAATRKTRFEIQQLLAERFPRPDVPERLQQITVPGAPIPATAPPVAGAPIGSGSNSLTIPEQSDPRLIGASTAGRTSARAQRVETPAQPERVTPLSPQRFAFQCTLDQETYQLLQDVRALMSHEVPTGEIALVLKGSLRLAKAHLERRKFAATDRPGPAHPSSSRRHIPAAVKRAVRERDGDQCTFVSDGGKRCPSRSKLEFDHIEPVARGGEATADNLRLVCRAHNQYAAERVFGADFMDCKRAEAGGQPRPARALGC